MRDTQTPYHPTVDFIVYCRVSVSHTVRGRVYAPLTVGRRTTTDDDEGRTGRTDRGRRRRRDGRRTDGGQDRGRRQRQGRRTTTAGHNLTFQIQHLGQNSNPNLLLHQMHFPESHSHFNPKSLI